MTNLLGTFRGTVGSAQTWVSQQWTQRVVQVSVYAAVVFFLLSNYSLIKVVEKSVKSVSGLKLGNEGTLVLHSVIFGLFMYVGTRFILDPILAKNIIGNEKHPLKVIIQLEGECNGVYVTEKTQHGFKVKELKNGNSNVPFTWHIAANRANKKGANGELESKYEDLRLPIGPNKLTPFQKTYSKTMVLGTFKYDLAICFIWFFHKRK